MGKLASTLFVMAIGIGPPAEAITISIEPVSTLAAVGSRFEIELLVSGLGDEAAPSLGAFDLDLLFDDDLVGVSAVSFSDQLDLSGLGSEQSITLFSDGITLSERSLDSAEDLDAMQRPAFLLASLIFEPMREGSTTIQVVVKSLEDSMDEQLLVDVVGGRVDVASSGVGIPEPSTALLLGLGLLGLSTRKRRSECGNRNRTAPAGSMRSTAVTWPPSP